MGQKKIIKFHLAIYIVAISVVVVMVIFNYKKKGEEDGEVGEMRWWCGEFALCM